MPRPNSSQTGKRRRNRSRARRIAPALSEERAQELQSLIGFKIKNVSLLSRAMTHSSAVPGNAADWSNERLEFLGDRVLGLVVADQLMIRFEKEREGGLAPRLNMLVSREACTHIARNLQIGAFLIMDDAERARGGEDKASLLANAMEAIIGVIYLEHGLKGAEKFIVTHWKEKFGALSLRPQDPKSALQEWSQGLKKPAPEYTVVDRQGPDHSPKFTIQVSVEGREPMLARGTSKQEAERKAAQLMLEDIGENIDV